MMDATYLLICQEQKLALHMFPGDISLPWPPMPAYAPPPEPTLETPQYKECAKTKNGPMTARHSIPPSTLVFAKVSGISHPATIIEESVNHYMVRWAAGGRARVDKAQVTRAL